MLLLHPPRPEQIDAFLQQQKCLDPTYVGIGTKGGKPPKGYTVNHIRVKLGIGRDVFLRAVQALKNWQQFQLGWVVVWPCSTPIKAGESLAIIARLPGLWWMNACRIVSVTSKDNVCDRFEFAYRTLPDHAAIGEERFLVEMDQSQNVWYDILAFSRPRHLLSKTGYWCFRHAQRRFAKQSADIMCGLINGANEDA